MHQSDQLQGRTVIIDGREWLYFSGTSYLGLPFEDAFKQRLFEGLHQYGANFGGSRRSNLQLPVFEEAEAFLAGIIGTEAVLTVSSGTMAGQLAVKSLNGAGHRIYFAPGRHPALDGEGQHFDGSYEEWVEKMLKQPPTGDHAPVFVLSSIDVLYAQRYSLDWIKKWPEKLPLIVLIDDSHGFGVLGKKGGGVFEELPERKNIRFVLVGSLGKAYGIPGGFLAADKDFIRLFREHPFFGGASPVVPAYLHALLHSKDLIRQQLAQLRSNIRYFSQNEYVRRHFHFMPDYPVFYLPDNELVDILADHHILISSFPYPGPDDPVVSRIVLSAAHTREDMDELLRRLGG